MISARRVALAALKSWRTDKRFADSIISDLLAKSNLPQQERAFAMELFYGILRNLTLLDFWIRELRTTPVRADLRDLLSLGLYQLLLLLTPAHAAVFETVELAPVRQRAVVNGILRAATRARSRLEQRAARQPLDVRFSHPSFLIERWRTNFGLQVGALCQWNNQAPPLYARINRLKGSPPAFLKQYSQGKAVTGHENFVELARLPSRPLETGECYVQDPSTTMACDLLDPSPGERVLDACAAPGGKTGYLAEKMKNKGLLVACDRDPRRINLLRENIARLGVEMARVVKHDWEKAQVPHEILLAAPFDRILLDAPCSNTGVIRRRVDVRWRLRSNDFLRMQRRQLAIVDAVAKLLKPDGVLVYSTCSIEPEENEQLIQQIAAAIPSLQPRGHKQLLPFRDELDGAFAARFVGTRLAATEKPSS